MSESDVMALLSQANPVRAVDLPQMEFPESVLGRRRRPQRRLVLVAAVVLAAVVAALIGVLVSRESPSDRHVVLPLLVPPPTLAHPVPSGTKVSLSKAAAALGATVVLPDTPFGRPSGKGAVWLDRVPGGWTIVAVTFPRSRLIVLYERPIPFKQPPEALFAAMAKGKSGFHLLDLEGVPAIATDQNSDVTGRNFGSVQFVDERVLVSVLGHYDTATLETVAQSILDRSRS
jgi:hypothetical protein